MTNWGDAGLGMHVIATKPLCLVPETSLSLRLRLAKPRRLRVPIPMVRQSFGEFVRSILFVPKNRDTACAKLVHDRLHVKAAANARYFTNRIMIHLPPPVGPARMGVSWG